VAELSVRSDAFRRCGRATISSHGYTHPRLHHALVAYRATADQLATPAPKEPLIVYHAKGAVHPSARYAFWRHGRNPR